MAVNRKTTPSVVAEGVGRTRKRTFWTSRGKLGDRGQNDSKGGTRKRKGKMIKRNQSHEAPTVNMGSRKLHFSDQSDADADQSLNYEVLLRIPANGTLLMNDSEATDSALFFSLSLTIFGLVGVVIFFRRCVRCPSPGSEDLFPETEAQEQCSEDGTKPSSPPPIHTLYNASPDQQQQSTPFPPRIFQEGGSTPNLPFNSVDLTSVASRECMTSPELDLTPADPSPMGFPIFPDSGIPFPVLSRQASSAFDASCSRFTSIDGRSDRSSLTFEPQNSISGVTSLRTLGLQDNLSPFLQEELQLNLIASSPSLLQQNTRPSPSRTSGVSFISSEVDSSKVVEDQSHPQAQQNLN